MSAQNFLKEEKHKLKGMPFKKKVEYIWEYYKLWIIGTICLVAAITSFVTTLVNNPDHIVLNAVFINASILDPDETTIAADFLKDSGIEAEENQVFLDTSMQINREAEDYMSSTFNQKLMAYIAAETIDAILEDELNFQYYAKNGMFTDLKELLPESLFLSLEESGRLCYASTEDDQEPKAYGIRINDSTVLEENNAFTEAPVFSVPANAPEPENAVKFLEYLLK